MGALDAFINKVAAAAPSFGSDWIKDGIGVLTVKTVLLEQKRAGAMFIVNFIVKEVKPKDGKPTNTVGSGASWSVNLSTNDSAAGNVKSFVMALMGVADDPAFAETFAELVNDDPTHKTLPYQPARGYDIGFETFHKETKKGADFMGINWHNVLNPEADVAARRATLACDKPKI